VDEWLSRARDAIATEDVDRAPLLCYLIGRAQGGRPLDELAEAVRPSTS
jgi:hypothetical protein